jgi:hypothetical protein
MTDQTERDYRQEFLATVAAWEANPARRAEELRDPARRMIYRCMRSTRYDRATQVELLDHAPDFDRFRREEIYYIILREILRYDSVTFKHRGEGRHKHDAKHEYYAGMALRWQCRPRISRRTWRRRLPDRVMDSGAVRCLVLCAIPTDDG